MRVKIRDKIKNYRTVWIEKGVVKLINQLKLPHKFEIHSCKNHRETAKAIRNMIVRGAPAIGATAAYGISQAAFEFKANNLKKFRVHMKKAESLLAKTRPTAYNLFHAIDFMKIFLREANSVEEAKQMVFFASNRYASESVEKCRKIGLFGEKLIKNNYKILTHCNAGALGCVDYGTALSPIRFAHYNKKNIHVFVDETRPRLQGYLTAWELQNEDIKFSIIADNAAGYFMQNGEIDLVIVGADRIAKNGDVANKIGTYEKAVLARENGIPFYVAAPLTTFDFNCKNGKDIVIEERSENEIHFILGKRITPKNSKARNPAFDVTPSKYIRGIITERGIVKPREIVDLFTIK